MIPSRTVCSSSSRCWPAQTAFCNPRLPIDVVAECGKSGIRHAVVLGGGFRESGPEGVELEAKLLAASRDYNVRLIGPNCLGLVNIHAADAGAATKSGIENLDGRHFCPFRVGVERPC